MRRLRAVWRTRGAAGFARFVASRLVGHRRDLVFEAATSGVDPMPEWSADERLVCLTRDTVAHALTPALEAELSRGEGADYIEGLRGRDAALVVVDPRGDVLHHSFVLFDTRTKVLLGEDRRTPLFAHCVTRADARGRGLYPRTLRHGLAMLQRAGHTRAVINCAPDNRASVAGIERAGFVLARTLDTWTLAACIGVQRVRDADGRRRMRVYVG